jgi:hypothetical protein
VRCQVEACPELASHEVLLVFTEAPPDQNVLITVCAGHVFAAHRQLVAFVETVRQVLQLQVPARVERRRMGVLDA